MNQARFFGTSTVIDPDTKGEVEIAHYKHENGGIFSLDVSYVEQVLDYDNEAIIQDPLNDGQKVCLTND